MKVIFLDIDGVLNTTVDNTKIHIRDRGFHFFIDFNLIPNLKQILELCLNQDIKIIVTSINALNKNSEMFNKLLLDYFHIKKKIVIDVDSRQNKERGLFVQDMIKKYDIDNFVVVDDDDFDILPYIPLNKFIKINSKIGFNINDVNKIKEIIKMDNSNKMMRKEN